MFFCLKPVGMPRVLLNSLWEILILLLCNKIKNWSPLVISMTSFCLHDHGQHDFSVTFNAFRPTNPATGRSLSILAKPGVGSCDPWIVKSCQIVISWEVWRACAKHPQDTATSHQRWHFETRNEPPSLSFTFSQVNPREYCKRFVDILSTVRNKSLLNLSEPVIDSMKGNVARFGTFFVVEFSPLLSIEFFLQQQEIVYRWNHVKSVAFLFVSVKSTRFAQR